MGRGLTEEEKIEFARRRAKEDQNIAEKLGMSVEQLHKIREDAQRRLEEEARQDALTDEQYEQLVAQLCGQFKTDEYRAEFKMVAKKRKERYVADGNVMSLREELQSDFDAMLRAEEYYSR